MSERKFQDEEPSAATRELCRSTREVFVGLVHEGFTERQALELLAHMLGAAVAGQRAGGS